MSSWMQRIAILLSLPMVVVEAQNRASVSPTFVASDSAGIRIVRNRAPSWGEIPKIRLEAVRRYGTLDTQDTNFQFRTPRDVGVDAAGNVYIYDHGGRRIQVYDSRGRFARTVGRRGQGPGELDNPAYFGVTPSGAITLVSQGYIQRFDGLGKETDRHRLTEPVSFPGGRVIRGGSWIVDAANGIWGGHPLYDPTAERGRPLIRILNRDGTMRQALGVPDFRTVEGLEVAIRSVFVVDAPDSGLYVSHGYRNLIERYATDGTLRLRVERPPLYPQVVAFTRVGTHLDYDVSAVSQGIEVDGKGRLWNQTFTRRVNSGLYSSRVNWSAPMFTFEVFDASGVLLGYVQPAVAFSSVRIFGDRLFLIDQYHEMTVHEYRIVER
jgi:hypothetical protein